MFENMLKSMLNLGVYTNKNIMEGVDKSDKTLLDLFCNRIFDRHLVMLNHLRRMLNPDKAQAALKNQPDHVIEGIHKLLALVKKDGSDHCSDDQNSSFETDNSAVIDENPDEVLFFLCWKHIVPENNWPFQNKIVF